MDLEGGGKRAGKLTWGDRRRPVTRRAGFSVTASGREYQRRQVDTVSLQPGSTLTVDFEIPGTTQGGIVGFGGYIYVEGSPTISLTSPAPKSVLKVFPAPNWGKFGSQWFSDGAPVKGLRTHRGVRPEHQSVHERPRRHEPVAGDGQARRRNPLGRVVGVCLPNRLAGRAAIT